MNKENKTDKKPVERKPRQKVELGTEDREIIRKQSKKLIIMGCILVVLVATYFILGAVQKNLEKKNSESAEEAKVFLTTDVASISEFSYTYNGREYSFKNIGGTWLYMDDISVDMDNDLVGALVKNLASIEYNTLIEGATDLAQYGLSEGYDTVRWKNTDGSYEIRIGAKNEVTGDYYIEDAGNGDICMVPYSFVAKYRTTADELKKVEIEETDTAGDAE